MEKYLNEEEQQKLILENEYIVRCVLKQLDIDYTDNRYEDLCSIGKIGLVKAALSFDKSQNVMFKSYATKCIRNEIFMAFRKWRRERQFISLDDTVNDHEGNVAILADVVEDNSSNFEDRFIKKQMLEECLGIILNVLSPKERSVILYKLSKDTQQEIAEELGFTQSYISRLDKNTVRKLKIYLEKGKDLRFERERLR